MGKQLLKGVFILFCIIFVLLILIGACVLFLNSPPDNANRDEVTIIIKNGESLNSIADNLESKGLIRSSLFLRLVSKFLNTEKDFIAGFYKIERGSSTLAIHNIIVSGKQSLIKITIPEGWTKSKIALYFEENDLMKAQSILDAIASARIRNKFNIKAANLEGYLFPDTYFIDETVNAEAMIERMVDNFFMNLAEISPGHESMDKSVLHEKVIMASIIEKEYRIKEEAPLIASVFYNRLRRNVGLESCATVEYVITEIYRQPHPERITIEMKDIDSPYNTYMWHGLPPGPVSNPGKIALSASFHPAETEYWYFCVKDEKTGEHYFSKDLEEHNQAKWQYKKKYGSTPP